MTDLAERRAVDVSRGAVRTAGARDRKRAHPCRLGEVADRLMTAHWFILVVTPMAEFRTVDWLDRRGVFAWTPCTTKIRRWNASTRREPRLFPTAPGYVVAGVASLASEWPHIASCETIRTVLGPADATEPRPVSPACVAAIRANLVADDPQAYEDRPRVTVKAGDRVEIALGAFAGVPGRVVSVEGWEALVALRLFGREFEVGARVQNLKGLAP